MFRRTNFSGIHCSSIDDILGPPLRPTDVEQEVVDSDESSSDSLLHDRQNLKPSVSRNHDSEEHEKVLPLHERNVPFPEIPKEPCHNPPESYKPSVNQENRPALTHPCCSVPHSSPDIASTNKVQSIMSAHNKSVSMCSLGQQGHVNTNEARDPFFTCLNTGVNKVSVGSMELHKLSLIGRGGTSEVFKVISNDGNVYALKEVYMKHSVPQIKAAYINEIKLLRKLKGKPEIITLHDYSWDKSEGILRLLLEYGEMDLSEIIRTRGTSRPLKQEPLLLLYLWQQMLRSVKIIHDEGIIHNDLKPENFVCSGLHLKLIDFGIANKIEEDHTSVERDIRCGTSNFMAPECIMTHQDEDYFKMFLLDTFKTISSSDITRTSFESLKNIGRAADVWSLGCILYLMIFQRTPFEHIKRKLQKWQAIVDPSFTILYPENLSIEAKDVLQCCLQRNPKHRPNIEQLLRHPFLTNNSI